MQTPAIGLIVIGVFTFVGGLIGCVGAIRERQRLLYMYSCALSIVILLQFGFGGAAAAVAAGNAPEIQGPLYGALKQNYKNFDWANLHIFFPPACYEGKTLNPKPNVTTPLYQYPLCAFDGKCVNDGSPDEQVCKCLSARVSVSGMYVLECARIGVGSTSGQVPRAARRRARAMHVAKCDTQAQAHSLASGHLLVGRCVVVSLSAFAGVPVWLSVYSSVSFVIVHALVCLYAFAPSHQCVCVQHVLHIHCMCTAFVLTAWLLFAWTVAFAPACVHQRCCKDGGTKCDQSQTQCMTGDKCLETFFGR